METAALSSKDLALSATRLISQTVFSLVALTCAVVATVLWFSAALTAHKSAGRRLWVRDVELSVFLAAF